MAATAIGRQTLSHRNYIRESVPTAHGAVLTQLAYILRYGDWACQFRTRVTGPVSIDLACLAHDIARAYVFCEIDDANRLSIIAAICHHLLGAASAAQAIYDLGGGDDAL